MGGYRKWGDSERARLERTMELEVSGGEGVQTDWNEVFSGLPQTKV